jgi:hypothetical protein
MSVSIAIGTPMGVAVHVVAEGALSSARLPAPPSLQAPPVPHPAPHPAPVPDPQSSMDLVLAIDCTASMDTYIEAAKQSLLEVANRFEQQYPGDGRLRIGVVAYRDHPPQDSSYITKLHPLSADVSAARAFIGALGASGGGDGPEAVGAALGEVVQCEWRTDATKVAVIIADAPPHGIGERGDGFPQGVPDSTDPFVAIDALAASGVRLYPVGCLPTLNQYRFATPFFVEAARKTGGKAVALTGAGRLGDVILGASVVEMGLTDLKADAQRRVATVAAANPAWTTHEVHIQVASDLQETGAVYRSLGGAQDLSEKTKNASLFEGVADLATARKKAPGAVVEDTAPTGGRDSPPCYRSLGSVSRSAGGEVGNDDDDGEPAYRSLGGGGGHDEPAYRSLGGGGGHDEPAYRSLGGGGHAHGHDAPVYRSASRSAHKRVAVDAAPKPDASLVTESCITADFLGALLVAA